MSDPENSKRRHLLFVLTILACGLTVWHTVGLVVDCPHWLHGVGWIWRRKIPSFTYPRFALFLGTASVWFSVLGLTIRARGTWPRWKVNVLLGWAILFTPFFQLVAVAQHQSQPLSVAFLTTTATTSGFFHEGVQIEDPIEFVQNHADHMPKYRGIHLMTQPPGWPVAFWATRELWERFPQAAEWVGHWFLRYDCLSYNLRNYTPAQIASASLQMSVLLWSGLGVLPLYLLGRNLFSHRVARLAAVVYPLLPGFPAFQAHFDVLYAVLAVTALWLAQRAISRGRWHDYLLLAALLVGMTLFGFGPLAIAALVDTFALVYILLHHAWSRYYWQRLLKMNAAVALMLIATWGGLWLLWQASWLDMFLISRRSHQTLRGNYPLWPLYNLYDFGMFLGLPLAVWAFAGGIAAARRAIRHTPQQGDALILGWLLALLGLNISGEVQAETARLWLFLMPPALLIGLGTLATGLEAKASERKNTEAWRWTVVVVLVLYGVEALTIACLFGGCCAPISSTPQARWTLPSSAQRISYQLGDSIALQGYEIKEGGDKVTITLYWRALTRTGADYSVFVHLLENRTELVSQSDGTPSGGRLPTWCWAPKEIVTDDHVLSVALQEDQSYQIGVGMYDWRTGARLPVDPPVADRVIRVPFAQITD